MPHEALFDDNDPHLARIREICLAYPSSAEKVSHGRPAFFTKKIFTYYGGSLKVDGVWHEHARSIVLLADEGEREALLRREYVFVPAYLGVSGWIGVDLPVFGAAKRWDEVAEVIDASYRLTARKSDLAQLADP